MAAEPLINAPEFTVSELSSALKRTVEDTFGHVRVRGEISGFRGPHSSGHCYFSLKDENAKIDAVIWKGVHGRMRFKPQEGLEVIATGKLTTFPGKSTYQIVIEAIEPAGIGALMALLEERKKKLATEGLFDEARKQLLPWLPDAAVEKAPARRSTKPAAASARSAARVSKRVFRRHRMQRQPRQHGAALLDALVVVIAIDDDALRPARACAD